MTIEFRCPYCTAAIQVTDALAGTAGQCPKCAARLTIPRPAGLAPPPKSKSTPAPPAEPAAPVASESPPPAPAVEVLAPLAAEADVPRVHPVGRRRRGKPVPLAVLVLLLLVVVGGTGGTVGYMVYTEWDRKQLKGELTAIESDAYELPAASLDRTQIAVAEPGRTELLKKLEAEPLPMRSELMQVQFRGSQAGLTVSILRGTKSVWYRVDTQRLPVLTAYIEKDTEPLRQRRNEEVERQATAFLQQFQAVTERKATEDSLTAFRDKLGLLMLVRGLGMEAVAVVGPNMYPCVYEEPGGALYFLLPPRVKQFELRGRKPPNGTPKFGGRFTVKVTERRVDEGQPPPEFGDKMGAPAPGTGGSATAIDN